MGRIPCSKCGACGLTILIVFSCLLVSVGLVLGIVGSAVYPGENRWAKNGVQAPNCHVKDWYLATDICGSKYRYVCYYPIWTVNFLTVDDGDQTRPVTNVTTTLYENKRYASGRALDLGYSHDIGSDGPCYYDVTNFAKARWSAANPAPFLGLLIAGWVMFFVGIILGAAWMVPICKS